MDCFVATLLAMTEATEKVLAMTSVYKLLAMTEATEKVLAMTCVRKLPAMTWGKFVIANEVRRSTLRAD